MNEPEVWTWLAFRGWVGIYQSFDRMGLITSDHPIDLFTETVYGIDLHPGDSILVDEFVYHKWDGLYHVKYDRRRLVNRI